METLGWNYKATTCHLIKYKKEHIFVLSIAGFISLLLFAGIALAATVDTKTAPKISSAPAPKMKVPTVSVPVQAVTPKVTIKAPTQTVAPKVRVPAQTHSPAPASPRPSNITRPSSPTRTVTPKVHIKTPVQTRPQPGSTVKVLPPPNPPTRPQMQPRVNIEKPVRQLPPMPEAIIRQPGSTAKYPEIPDPPNSPRTVPGIDSAYAPSGMAAQPGLNHQAPGAYNPAGIYIPGIAPPVTVNPAIENSKFNDPRMRQIVDRQDVLDSVKAAERAKVIGDAWNEFRQIGGRVSDRGKLGDIFGENGLNGPQSGSGKPENNYTDANSWNYGGSPTGQIDTSKQGWASKNTTTVETTPTGHTSETRDENDELISQTESSSTPNDNGGTTTTTTTRTRGGQTIDITATDANDDVIGSATENTIVDFQDGSMTSTASVSSKTADGTSYVDYYRNGAHVGTEYVTPADRQPNETETSNKYGGCNPVSGRGCKDERVDPMNMIISPTRGNAYTDSGTSLPIIGPDAVTDYEHGNRGGGGGGFNPIDMKDPPKGVPVGASLDGELGAFEP
jgi:hypothetical protein